MAATTTPTASPCGSPEAASRPAFRYGATDDYGYYAVQDKVSIYDLHATILHIMGLNHELLTYRHGGTRLSADGCVWKCSEGDTDLKQLSRGKSP